MPTPIFSSRVAIYDASPCMGGALTSASALAEVRSRSGEETDLYAVADAPAAVAAPFSSYRYVRPASLSATNGARYFFRELRRAYTLHRLWTERRPTSVLLNNGPQSNLAGIIAAALLGIPTTQYLRGPVARTRLARLLLRMTTEVFAVGHEALDCAKALGRDAILVDEGLSASQLPSPRGSGASGLFFASAALRWKGVHVAVEGYERARRMGLLAKLHLCLIPSPEGHPWAEPARFDDVLGVEVHRAPRNLDRIRAGCDVFVHASLEPEPFGRSLLEAMAAGLCPVVPNAGWPGRIIQHGVNGLVYPAGDANALAHHLVTLERTPLLAAQLGVRARETVQRYRAELTFAPVLRHLAALTEPRASRKGTSVPLGSSGDCAGPERTALERAA